MTRRHHVRGTALAALALVAVACSGGADGDAAGAEGAPAASAPAVDDEHGDPHHEHDTGAHGADDHDQDPAGSAEGIPSDAPAVESTDEPTSATERTLAALAAMDPDRLASSHDHDDERHHAAHDGDRDQEGDGDRPEAPVHPDGIDPHRLVIPAIGVDADVIDLGLEDDGTMEVPSDFAQTGWFTPGPRPGRVGPAVIAGHVDSRDGPAVFVDLADLEVGDEIEVHDPDGAVVAFAVREQEQVPKDDFPTRRVYGGTPGPELRLITCGGIFDRSIGHYDDNIIVYADRVDT